MKKNVDASLAARLAEGSPSQKVDSLFAYMEEKGQSHYDEVVTQMEHALQCAHQARLAGADQVRVASALLHDLGHFLIDEHNKEVDFLADDFFHEEVGAEYLEPFFIEAVTEPMKLHVPGQALYLQHRGRLLRQPVPGIQAQFQVAGRIHVRRGKEGIRAKSLLPAGGATEEVGRFGQGSGSRDRGAGKLPPGCRRVA